MTYQRESSTRSRAWRYSPRFGASQPRSARRYQTDEDVGRPACRRGPCARRYPGMDVSDERDAGTNQHDKRTR